ncbi:MAG: hypothetical protein Q4E68_05700 [Prevotellaceae bacterium]|nr:hypothetical protein [Prevotellaceae bacterium]
MTGDSKNARKIIFVLDMLSQNIKRRYNYLKCDIMNVYRNIHYYKKLRFERVQQKNVLYFVIDPLVKHPGIADRIKAIVAIYNHTKKTDCRFKLYFRDPFDLSKFLAPVYDWRMELSDLEYSLVDTRFINETNRKEIRKLRSDKQYHCYRYTGNLLPYQFDDTGYKWRDLFNELFTPSERLINAYNQLKLDASQYVSIHIRFVNALEHFENSLFDNYIESDVERLALIEKCKVGIDNVIRRNPDKMVLVFSDSRKFLDSLKDMSVRILNVDDIGHISETCNSKVHMKTFLDLYVMSKSQAIYRLRSKELYNRSCFALLAARMGDVKFYDVELG